MASYRLLIDDKGKITFGKHRGYNLDHVAETDPNYLRWLLDQSWLDDATRRKVETSVGVDQPDPDAPEPEPNPALAAVAFPGVVWRWQSAMRTQYADNPDALAIVESGEKLLRELCTEFTNRPWLNLDGIA